jgi:sugar O-acyltransferase (sialic acid O-acetyltransferase NeuD family)
VIKKVVVYGNTVLSKTLYYDAINNPYFEIVCFTVDEEYLHDSEFLGLPQINFQEITESYPPSEYDMIAILGGYRCMRNREIMYFKAKNKGYKLRNYISPSCEITPEIHMGENNLIFSQAYIGRGGKIGSNNIIREQVYLGHDFIIGNNNFIGAGCKIGGTCVIENTCYLGLGATIINNTTLAEETLVGAGSVVIRNTKPYSKNVGNPSRVIGYHKEEGIKMRVNHE